MAASFDVSGARGMLQKVSEATLTGLSLADAAKTTGWMDGIKVTRVEGPTTWRLLQEGVDGTQEELVFTVRRVMIAKDLPPILQRPRLSPTHYKYLRQGVTISGLGTTPFEQAMATASEIYGIFDRNFVDGQMESWSSSGSPGPENCAGLDASNRYMTPRRDVPEAQHHPFTALVDPKGILEDMAVSSGYVHTDENEVFYFMSQLDGAGKRKFDSAPPQTFRIGDVVELQVSFVAIPLKGDQYKMVTIMCSIALLDGSFGQSAQKTKKVPKPSHPVPKTILSIKRRVGYGLMEAEAEEGREK